MKDRVSRYPGRVRLTPVDGNPGVYDMERADEPSEPGTALSKSNLLKDSTAALFGQPSSAVIDSILSGLSLLHGNGEPTGDIAASIGQCYYDESQEEFYSCISKTGATSNWKRIGLGNNALFGTRGPILVTETQVLDMHSYGLNVGDHVNVICVGGGGGGGSSNGYVYSSTTEYAIPGKDAGSLGGYGSGGSGGSSTASHARQGAGGGSGFVTFNTVALNQTAIPITIGKGGKGGAQLESGYSNYGAPGENGGTTSFGTLCYANGGIGGAKGATYGDSSVAKGGDGYNKGGDGSNATTGSAGIGGRGVVKDGNFEIKTDDAASKSANGVVMIWY